MESTNQLEGVRIPLIILLQDKGDAFEVFATSRFGLDSTLQNAVGRLAVEGVKSGEVRDGLGRKWAWSAGRQFAAGQGVGLQGELVLQSGENGVHRSDGHHLLELAAWISNQLQHDANNLATAVLGVATILELKLPKNEENGTQIGRLHRACESYRAKVEQFRVFQETERSNGCTSASVIERWCLEKPGVRLESGSTTRAQQDWRLPCSAGLFRFLLGCFPESGGFTLFGWRDFSCHSRLLEG